jgi:hypothetical protein
MTDDNIIGIDGRQAAQLRTDQAEREKREEIVRAKLKCVGFKLQPGMVPPSYTIAHPHPPQPPSAAAPSTTQITTSTTRHCLLARVSSRDWWRKSCHDFPIHDIISLLHIEPGAGPFRTLPVFV